jgi:hypothetical protein
MAMGLKGMGWIGWESMAAAVMDLSIGLFHLSSQAFATG